MESDRRTFLTSAMLGGGAALLPFSSVLSDEVEIRYKKVDDAYKKPVLKVDLFTESVIIDTLELLEYKGNFICRVRSKMGAVGYAFANSRMSSLYPIFMKLLQPFFLNKDAVQLESLLYEVYVHKSNYKLQSVALWVPLATIEFAILDMLGRIVQRPMGELIGDIYNTDIKLYQANSTRGITAEETMDQILAQLEISQAQAVKFKVGGRMSAPEEPKGRSERLIPLVRKTLGDEMFLCADSNGSYNVEEAIRIGKIMEDYNYDFYEEPVPFDWYEETKKVADSLEIAVAGGEQEGSMRNFRWLLANDALQILQTDMFYFGGMIRSMKTARMAEALGISHTPHVSNIGYVYMLHFVSAIPNAGRYHEFKSPFNSKMEFECKTSSLLPENGSVKVPTGPGLGIDFDPNFINRHRFIK